MTDEKLIPIDDEPIRSSKPSAPPSYEQAAIEHGDLPVRKGPPPSTTGGPGKPLPRGPFPLDIPILSHLRGKRVILASSSPRRKQILSILNLPFEVTPSLKPENLDKAALGPFNYVLQTCTQKCLDVYAQSLATTTTTTSRASIPDPALVLAFDTIIVTNGGRILEKPRSEADHVAMLRALRDQGAHKCYTAVAALAPREDARDPGYNLETTVEESRVWFARDVGDDLIEAYVRTREGVDKAGGYGLQGLGALLVEKIEGCPDNVVGLPLRATVRLMERAVFRQGDEDRDGDEEEDDE